MNNKKLSEHNGETVSYPDYSESEWKDIQYSANNGNMNSKIDVIMKNQLTLNVKLNTLLNNLNKDVTGGSVIPE